MLSRRLGALGIVTAVVTLGWAAAASAATPTLTLACIPQRPGGQVAVFPIPGTRYNRPETQITFRGIRSDQIGSVTVRGSRSGLHSGRVLPDSDCDGGSFVPAEHFVKGETVTVSTGLNVLGGRNGRFSFKIADALPLAKGWPSRWPPRRR